MITWEPRTTPIFLSQRLSEIAAVDDTGRTVEISGRQGTLTAACRKRPAVRGDGTAVCAAGPQARRLASLRGTLDVLLPGRVERFEFADLEQAANVQQRHAGVTVTLEQTRENDEAQEVHMRVRIRCGRQRPGIASRLDLQERAYLVDADGKRLACGGQRVVSQEADGVGMAYLFALTRPLSDYRFVYETPVADRSQRRVRIEGHGLAMKNAARER